MSVCLEFRDYHVDLGASPRAVWTFDNDESSPNVHILEIGYSLAVELQRPCWCLSSATGDYAQVLITGCTVCFSVAGSSCDTVSLTFSCCSSMSREPSIKIGRASCRERV